MQDQSWGPSTIKTLKRAAMCWLGGGFNDENPLKILSSVPVIVDRGEDEYLGRRGGPRCGGTSMMKTP